MRGLAGCTKFSNLGGSQLLFLIQTKSLGTWRCVREKSWGCVFTLNKQKISGLLIFNKGSLLIFLDLGLIVYLENSMNAKGLQVVFFIIFYFLFFVLCTKLSLVCSS